MFAAGQSDSGLAIGQRSLGNTGLMLTELGFGAASLGNLYHEVTDDDARATLGAAHSAGLKYFDTAPYYGFGLSERRVGDMVRGLERESFVLSTKVGRILKPISDHTGSAIRHGFCSPMPFRPVYDYSYHGILRSYEDSLQRLGLSSIDILLVHDIGSLTHGAEAANYFREFATSGYLALDELRASGDIKAVGLGVNEWEVCEAAMEIGRFDCFLLAGRYTLLEQSALETFMPKCAAHGASLIIGGVYNSGILATGTKGNGQLYYNYEPAPPNIIDSVAGIEAVCEAHNVPLPAAALQFPLASSLVSSVIPGLGSARRIQQTLDLFSCPIPKSFWSDLKTEGLLNERVPTP